MSNHHNWLHQQLDTWLGDEIINPQQAQALRSRYPAQQERQWGNLVIPTIGSIVFACGVILFFAYNWADISKFAKLGIIVFSVTLAHGTAIWMATKNNTPYSESLHALGSMLFIAAIILISQIYHIDDYYPNALILMAGSTLLLAWSKSSMTQALIATVLVTMWAFSEIFDFGMTNHFSILIILFGILPLAIRIRSAALMFFASAALMICYGSNLGQIDDDLLFQGILFLSAAYIVVGFYLRHTASAKCTAVIGFNGMMIYYVLMYILSFKDSLRHIKFSQLPDSAIESLYYGLPLLGLIILIPIVLYRAVKFNLGKLVTIQLLLVCCSLAIFACFGFASNFYSRVIDYKFIFTIAVNLILLAHFVIIIIEGSRDTQWGKTSVGCILFSILIFSRFVDLFDSLLVRSAIFILLGIGLFVIGHYYNSHKNQQSGASHV